MRVRLLSLASLNSKAPGFTGLASAPSPRRHLHARPVGGLEQVIDHDLECRISRRRLPTPRRCPAGPST